MGGSERTSKASCASKSEQSERQATSRRKPRCLRHLLSYAFSILFAVLWSTGGARASVANSRASVPACDQRERAGERTSEASVRARVSVALAVRAFHRVPAIGRAGERTSKASVRAE